MRITKWDTGKADETCELQGGGLGNHRKTWDRNLGENLVKT